MTKPSAAHPLFVQSDELLLRLGAGRGRLEVGRVQLGQYELDDVLDGQAARRAQPGRRGHHVLQHTAPHGG